jgi:hypothetical protein
MTAIAAATISILAIAGLAWAARRITGYSICPICLGVGGTWLWMVVARYFGVEFDAAMLPILLGGSVVGVTYQLEKRLPEGRSSLLWKTLFLPVGFIAAYGLAEPDWPVLGAAIAAAGVLTGVFFLPRRAARQSSETVQKLEQQMKNCC